LNPYHKTNKLRWQKAAKKWGEMHDRRGTWKLAPADPELLLGPQEMVWLNEVKNKQVCVRGSGDNLVVFPLAGLGAAVTSVDISETQLENAKRRARELKLDITFQCADVSDLSMIAHETFDMVYTGGHVAVWEADLQQYYREAIRVLRPGGLFIINEYHPFRRIWEDRSDRLSVRETYFNRGPHLFNVSEGLFEKGPGNIPSYEFYWTIADYLNAVMETGAAILAFKEYGDEPEGFETAPTGGLPDHFLLVARKDLAEQSNSRKNQKSSQ
jgi:SAM-dependent methyltransferase